MAQLKKDYQLAELTPADRAMLDYTVKLTLEPWSMAEADVAESVAEGRSGRSLDRGGRRRPQFRSFTSGGSSFAPGAGGQPIVVVVELDGREVARSMERVSERDGGLRVKLRAGG